MKKILGIIIIIAFIIAVINAEHPEQEPEDDTMPRSRSFVNMEIGDIEYLQLMGERKK